MAAMARVNGGGLAEDGRCLADASERGQECARPS